MAREAVLPRDFREIGLFGPEIGGLTFCSLVLVRRRSGQEKRDVGLFREG